MGVDWCVAHVSSGPVVPQARQLRVGARCLPHEQMGGLVRGPCFFSAEVKTTPLRQFDKAQRFLTIEAKRDVSTLNDERANNNIKRVRFR
eukprot:scaffold7800_cov113-Isochrysis_galbana.AAC.2